MPEEKTQFEELMSTLRQQRDELRVKVHLGKAELKEEWDELEQKLAQLTHDYEPVRDAVGETAQDVWASLKLVGQEVKRGFDRVRKSV